LPTTIKLGFEFNQELGGPGCQMTLERLGSYPFGNVENSKQNDSEWTGQMIISPRLATGPFAWDHSCTVLDENGVRSNG